MSAVSPSVYRQSPSLWQRWKRFFWRCLLSSTCLLLLYGPVNLAIAHWLWPQPDGILILGGQPDREGVAARLAKVQPDLPLWSSSGLGPDQAYPIFDALGVSRDRITFDYRAVDTVSNFTTLVKTFQQQNRHHLYLITSDYHMPRARAIATIILGSHHIAFTPVAAPSTQPAESPFRIGRDMVRSWLWLTTGWSGAAIRNG
ncbi:YdcF family protein [Nodosilinea sp. E11]|uniref:YdcF family protein n=1 Tax=Nodosilinea sp. E11 TaxID=3037479 RepID=UPI00293460B6|nr:YdcF family protein [Nodosilinea sp. E11]WOD41535.1 YdcF family protein [Nodosilinea sp. E11]